MRQLKNILRRFAPFFIILFITVFLVFVKFPRDSIYVSVGLARWLIQPFTQSARILSSTAVAVWFDYLALHNVKKENDALKKIIKMLEGDNIELVSLRKEVSRLRGILDLRPKLPYHLEIAEVVSVDMAEDRVAFWINAGTRRGVYEAQPVIDHNGVIGQVYKAFPSRSLVLSLYDPLFRLHVMNARTDERGILTGETDSASGFLRLLYVHRKTELEEDDLLVTSGLGGIYPSGLGVGRVRKITRPKTLLESHVWVEPLVDIHRIQEVYVVTSKVDRDIE